MMTVEKTLTFNLGDLRTARIVCECGGVAEMPIDQLRTMTAPTSQCQFCARKFASELPSADERAINELGRMVLILKQCKGFSLEFPLPMPSGG